MSERGVEQVSDQVVEQLSENVSEWLTEWVWELTREKSNQWVSDLHRVSDQVIG